MAYIITEACNGCGACAKICPVEAISGEKKAMHVIDQDICIDCGACGRVCARDGVHRGVMDADGKFFADRSDPGMIDSQTRLFLRRSQWQKPVFDIKACSSCGICVDACPVGNIALEFGPGLKGPHGVPRLQDEKACIACGFCAEECPLDAIEMRAPQETRAASAG